MPCVIRGWPKDGFKKYMNDLLEELIESDTLIEPDDISTQWVDELTNTLRLDAEINSN